MQSHEKFSDTNGNKVFVYKYMNKKNRWFAKAMNLKRFILPFVPPFLPGRVESVFELLGILGTFKMAEHSHTGFPHSKPWSLSSFFKHCSNFPTLGQAFFSILQTSRPRGQHVCSKFPKIPHVGCAQTCKVPTSSPGAPPPPSGITLIAA